METANSRDMRDGLISRHSMNGQKKRKESGMTEKTELAPRDADNTLLSVQAHIARGGRILRLVCRIARVLLIISLVANTV